MSSIKPDFTMRELFKEIAGMDQDVDLGETLTTREMMPLFDVQSLKSVRARIRPLVTAGILVCTRKKVKNMAGVTAPVPAYAVNPTKSWGDVLKVVDGA